METPDITKTTERHLNHILYFKKWVLVLEPAENSLIMAGSCVLDVFWLANQRDS